MRVIPCCIRSIYKYRYTFERNYQKKVSLICSYNIQNLDSNNDLVVLSTQKSNNKIDLVVSTGAYLHRAPLWNCMTGANVRRVVY